jgi:V/A-type H+-transporting ATPase subunit C
MEANLIRYEEYLTVAGLESTADFFAFLKNHPGYREIFNSYDEHGLHRGEAEGFFIYSVYLDFSRIYEFAGIDQRKALDFTFFRFEVTILKACLQKVYNHTGDYGLSIFTDFFSRHSLLDIKALSACSSMDDFVVCLKNTEYYPLLHNLLNKNGITPFDYQLQLDIYYFKKAWQLKDKLLSGEDQKAVSHSLGTEIDLLNLLWLFRTKKYFSVRSADSYAYIIPITYKLTKDKLLQLMEAGSVEEFITVTRTTYYEKLSSSLADGSIENTCEKQLDKVYKDNRSRYTASMSPVNYYLYLKQKEVKRLTTALECIRYKLSPQDALRHIQPN